MDLKRISIKLWGAIYMREREREREREGWRFAKTVSQITKKSIQDCWLQNQREYNCRYQKEEPTTMVFILILFSKEKWN